MAALLVTMLAATPAAAAERGYTVTGFDRVRIAGAVVADLRVGGGTAVRASGPAVVLDALEVRVDARTLVIRPRQGGAPLPPGGIRVTIATPALAAATLEGSGRLAIDRVRGDRFDLIGSGSGAISVGRIETGRLAVMLTGAGRATLAGRADFVRAELTGAATLAAPALTATALELSLTGSGGAEIAATRTALVVARGSGDATVTGTPACTVRQSGTGTVRCGRQ